MENKSTKIYCPQCDGSKNVGREIDEDGNLVHNCGMCGSKGYIEGAEYKEKNKIGINGLAKEIHEIAVEHGFWECDTCYGKGKISIVPLGRDFIVCPMCRGTKKYRNDGECLALMTSEISETLEEIRAGKEARYFNADKPDKPEGWAVELADCLIRILDYTEAKGIDNFEEIIKEKIEYNRNREYKHGKKF